MSSLNEVVKHLQTQNQTLEDVAASVKSMLAEDVKARLAEERSAGDREEARRKAEEEQRKIEETMKQPNWQQKETCIDYFQGECIKACSDLAADDMIEYESVMRGSHSVKGGKRSQRSKTKI